MTTKTCTLTGKQFSVSDYEREFCERREIPLPTRHPIERIRNMFAFRNRVYLSNGTCAFTGDKMFTCVPPEAGRTVYDVEVWESDAWDALAFGRDYDFKRPFFEQFAELARAVPMPNLAVIRSTMENSDFANGITGAKNAYLLFAASHTQDCMYSFCVNHSQSIVDCVNATHSELCYDCVHISDCYSLRHSANCSHCSESAFLYSCQSCKNCFGCVNLVGKEYCFFNEQLTKTEYAKRIAAIDLGSYREVERIRGELAERIRAFPVRYMRGKFNEQSTGDHLLQTRNAMRCFFATECEDTEWCVWTNRVKSSLFYCAYGNGSELIYNSYSCGDACYNLRFCGECWQSAKDLEYCLFTGFGSNDCFGCFGLKRKHYCVFNRQYTKPEYLDLVGRIRAHMRSTGEYGQFFPPSLSPFFYNYSDARFFLPADPEVVVPLGYHWKDSDEPAAANPFPFPDHIKEVGTDAETLTFSCESTGRAFRVVRQEIEFYRNQNIPLPRKAPLVRIAERGAAMAIGELASRVCSHCAKSIMSVHDPAIRPVVCEECFQELI